MGAIDLAPIFVAKSSIKDGSRIALSLMDGMGCLALTLKAEGWARMGIDTIIAVEKNPKARKVCSAANPADGDFPGVEHGLNGKHDIYSISEEDISCLASGSIVLFSASPECNDFSKLRLLEDRPEYRGPAREPGKDPRPGLDGKHGRTFRRVIEILGWVQKHHPGVKYFIENVNFKDMPSDWKEVCEALGEPIDIVAHDHSNTKRNRSYWTNINVPEDFRKEHPPLEPNNSCGWRAQHSVSG
jgi:site-specific DNA-cytosine methylase